MLSVAAPHDRSTRPSAPVAVSVPGALGGTVSDAIGVSRSTTISAALNARL
jgi:hypothetical protein